MITVNNTFSMRMGNRELLLLLDAAADSHKEKLLAHRTRELETPSVTLPGSVEFFYRNHPNFLRITRLRSNGRGREVAKDNQTKERNERP